MHCASCRLRIQLTSALANQRPALQEESRSDFRPPHQQCLLGIHPPTLGRIER